MFAESNQEVVLQPLYLLKKYFNETEIQKLKRQKKTLTL